MTGSASHRADNPLAADLEHILDAGGDLFEELRGARLFVTGGSGFVGRWMLESFAWANDALGLDAEIVALSRDPQRFAAAAPHLDRPGTITLLGGDMRDFDIPDVGFSHVLHIATETDLARCATEPTLQFDSAVEGTRRLLELARTRGARRFLYTSSGAIYGRQPADMPHVAEDAPIAPLPQDASASYAHGKRAAEFLCAAEHVESGLETTIARLFAFVGPGLPLTAGYAVGNFVGDALAGRAIHISGDGTPKRSYLYAADLAWWLWTILLRGEAARPYNVGSDAELSIAELAATVNAALGLAAGVEVAGTPAPGAPALRYVPDITRATTELGLSVAVPLEEGIRRMARWHTARAVSPQE